MNQVSMWLVAVTAMKIPPRIKTVTGTTTASHRGVVGAADEASTETTGADKVILATGPPRYGNFCFHPLSPD